jgi:antirestriction protein ArdC
MTDIIIAELDAGCVPWVQPHQTFSAPWKSQSPNLPCAKPLDGEERHQCPIALAGLQVEHCYAL